MSPVFGEAGPVRDTDPRTALLSSFNGQNPGGEWRLYLADVDAGGQNTLVSWGLEIATAAFPVRGRYLFYNNSAWDGNDPTPNPADDNASVNNSMLRQRAFLERNCAWFSPFVKTADPKKADIF
ncbi:MAG: hypothetical protein AB9869_23655 [Verrucomicrobiia bacterium]